LAGLIVSDTPGGSANFAMLPRMAKGLGIYGGELPVNEPLSTG
jgi:hypothetical protein